MIIKQTALIMGMPIHITISTGERQQIQAKYAIDEAFAWFRKVDERFSSYKPNSELSKLNRGELSDSQLSADMTEVLSYCLTIEDMTNSYFRLIRHGVIDPTGLVKGWSIDRASEVIKKFGFNDHLIDAGGDMIASGKKTAQSGWSVGIKYPPEPHLIAKQLELSNYSIATSGTYERGLHIDALDNTPANEIVSISVIGADMALTDCYATAAFAMGKAGIEFIEQQDGFEGYMIVNSTEAIATTHFSKFETKAAILH